MKAIPIPGGGVMHVEPNIEDARVELIAHLEVPCCIGFAECGPERCTCWEPVLDPSPNGVIAEGPMAQRTSCCHDCAYRNGSPEREPGGQQERDLDTVARHHVFLCHKGFARVVEWRHPSGAVYVPDFDHYEAFQRDGRGWMADGRPAELCAGWAAHRHGMGIA